MLLSAATDGVGIVLLVPLLAAADQAGGAIAVDLNFGQLRLADSLPQLLMIFVILVVLRSALVFWSDMQRARIQHELVDGLRQHCYAVLAHAEWQWLSTQRAADHNATLVTNIAMVGLSFDVTMRSFSALLVAAGLLVAGLYISWQATVFAIIAGGFALLAQSGIRKRSALRGQEINQGNRDLHRHVEQGLALIRLSRIFGQEDRQIAAFSRATNGIRDRKLASIRDQGIGQAAMQIGAALLLAAFAYWGLAIAGMSYPILIPMLLILLRAAALFSVVQQGWTDWLHAAPAFVEVSRLITEGELHSEPSIDDEAGFDLSTALELDAVSFRYSGRAEPALKQVSLCLPARRTILLTGESGSGKSTIADLVMGLIAPSEGQIRIDGVALSGSERMRWRRHVSYVEQESVLAHASVRDNLLWAKPDATEAELQEALAMASADFVLAWSEGLDTLVGDAGLRVSGGERQRIAIARALLRKPELLILDEATSALDRENEAQILAAVDRLHGRMTILLIGHREGLAERADQRIDLQSNGVVKMTQLRDTGLAQPDR
jgi:ATP-binding cassette, subfamily C, bacterial